MPTLRLATRTSPLAMWQTRRLAWLLRRRHANIHIEVVPVTNALGDRDRVTPLSSMPGIGVFTKEVQTAVLADQADIAVHSCKDLPTIPVPGLAPAVILERTDARDAVIGARQLADLPNGARVGTSSLRRQVQLQALRPDLKFEDLRGNVATRIAAVTDGPLDGTMLACAGLRRLGILRDQPVFPLGFDLMLPAPAQGAMAAEYRDGDTVAERLLSDLQDWRTSRAVNAERQVLSSLGGGCSLPFGCLVDRVGHHWRGRAVWWRDERLVYANALAVTDQALVTSLLKQLQP